MSDISKEMGAQYILAWRKAVRVLEEVRAKELSSVNTPAALQSLLPAFHACIRDRKASDSSGLIEQQRIFSRARRR